VVSELYAPTGLYVAERRCGGLVRFLDKIAGSSGGLAGMYALLARRKGWVPSL
jgi:hypothetical protein